MERTTRLRRYLRKDYTQIVEFPVEIVGRDGLVRRYSFDDSVRLYQRRIHSAPMRYDDGDVIEAEVRHCRQRIEQLRRSYLEHFGWGTLRAGRLGGQLDGPLAAEVAAFLRRLFAQDKLGEADATTTLTLELVDSGTGDVFYVRRAGTEESWLLYAWRLDLGAPSGARDAAREAVARLASAPVGEGVERLLALAEGPDVVLALAGSGAWDGPPLTEEDSSTQTPRDALHAGIRALYDGDPAGALGVLEGGLDAQPGRVALAQAAALVALLERQSERAEFAARFGLLQRPGDPLLAYFLAIALYRSRATAAADAVVTEAQERNPQAPLLALAAGVVAIGQGRLFTAWRALGVAEGRERAGYPARAAATLRSVLLKWAGGGLVGSALVGTGSVLLVADQHAAGLALLALGLTCSGFAVRWLRRHERTLREGLPNRGVPRLVSLELLPRDRELERHH